MSDNNKVRLSSITNPRDYITFEASPEINENRNVNYKSQDLLHMPGSILAYANTSTRTFNMVVKLFSRNIEEATKNSENLQILRSWTLPYFGKSQLDLTKTQIENKERLNRGKKSFKSANDAVLNNPSDYELYNNLLGQPPDILHLNAYSNSDNSVNGDFTGNLNNIPVVLSQLGNSYPADVTYFPTIHGEPFPVIMTVDILLTEAHSPREYSNFNLADFKSGRLPHF
jgi:hypothetical protein